MQATLSINAKTPQPDAIPAPQTYAVAPNAHVRRGAFVTNESVVIFLATLESGNADDAFSQDGWLTEVKRGLETVNADAEALFSGLKGSNAVMKSTLPLAAKGDLGAEGEVRSNVGLVEQGDKR